MMGLMVSVSTDLDLIFQGQIPFTILTLTQAGDHSPYHKRESHQGVGPRLRILF